jgi:hypothetical protein
MEMMKCIPVVLSLTGLTRLNLAWFSMRIFWSETLCCCHTFMSCRLCISMAPPLRSLRSAPSHPAEVSQPWGLQTARMREDVPGGRASLGHKPGAPGCDGLGLLAVT